MSIKKLTIIYIINGVAIGIILGFIIMSLIDSYNNRTPDAQIFNDYKEAGESGRLK